jgi:hypothetical protein
MLIKKFEVVLNVEYGGFYFDEEMANWLKEHRNWTTDDDGFVAPSLVKLSGGYYYPVDRLDVAALRCNPDLLDCVKTLQKKYHDKGLSRFEMKRLQPRPKVADLEIKEIEIKFEVEDFNDGKEKVIINTFD